MSGRVLKVLSLFLIFALPTSLLCAETRAAMVFASGIASLNGAALPRSTSIFAGDVLETSKNSAIVINANGSTIQMGASSRVQFQGNSIDLDSGVTQVNTHTGMKVQADSLTVTPVDRNAKFQVTRGTGKVMVTAMNGSVSVLTGKVSDVVAAGEAKAYSDDPADEKEKKKRDKVGAVAVSDKELFLWSGAALAGGGVLAWWLLRDGRKPLSNQLP